MLHLLSFRSGSSALLGTSAGAAAANASSDYKTSLALGPPAVDLPLLDRHGTFLTNTTTNDGAVRRSGTLAGTKSRPDRGYSPQRSEHETLDD
jgi:hypothetical protein